MNDAAFLPHSKRFLSYHPIALARIPDGSITIQITDATKTLVPNTHLVLTDNATNVTRLCHTHAPLKCRDETAKSQIYEVLCCFDNGRILAMILVTVRIVGSIGCQILTCMGRPA